MVNDLLSMAAAGSAIFLLWLALYPLTRERFSARWHYRALKAGLFFLLFPIRPCLRLWARLAAAPMPAAASPAEPAVSEGAVLPAVTVLPSADAAPALPHASPSFFLTAETLELLAVLWAAGAAALLVYKLAAYVRFRRRLFRCCGGQVSPEAEEVFHACRAELGVRGRVRLLCAPDIQTPLVTGLLRPTVILPGGDLSREELRYILLHELTHVKHHDLWIRAAALAAMVLHWYDPAVYLLARHIQVLSEQSCDERVAGALTRQERYAYGKTILKVAADMTAGAAAFAVPMSMRRTLERRLMRVLHPKFMSTKATLAACAAAVVLLACGTAAALAARVPVQAGEPEPAALQEQPAAIPGTEDAAGVPDETVPEPEKAPASAPDDGDQADTPFPREEIFATLRPSDTPGQYTYVDADGLTRRVSEAVLDRLVDHDYPRNSRGETYGPDLTPLVGYAPDLVGAVGTKGESGYIRSSDQMDYHLETLEEVDAYMKWQEANPGPYTIPLYNSEGNIIGQFQYGGGQQPNTAGMTIEEAKQAVEAAGIEETPDTANGATVTLYAVEAGEECLWLTLEISGQYTEGPSYMFERTSLEGVSAQDIPGFGIQVGGSFIYSQDGCTVQEDGSLRILVLYKLPAGSESLRNGGHLKLRLENLLADRDLVCQGIWELEFELAPVKSQFVLTLENVSLPVWDRIQTSQYTVTFQQVQIHDTGMRLYTGPENAGYLLFPDVALVMEDGTEITKNSARANWEGTPEDSRWVTSYTWSRAVDLSQAEAMRWGDVIIPLK